MWRAILDLGSLSEGIAANIERFKTFITMISIRAQRITLWPEYALIVQNGRNDLWWNRTRAVKQRHLISEVGGSFMMREWQFGEVDLLPTVGILDYNGKVLMRKVSVVRPATEGNIVSRDGNPQWCHCLFYRSLLGWGVMQRHALLAPTGLKRILIRSANPNFSIRKLSIRKTGK